MTASSNFGNVFSVLVASAFIPFLPMLAIHLLIQNLMYDLSQLALGQNGSRVPAQTTQMGRAQHQTPYAVDWANVVNFDITTFALMWYVFAANTPAMQSLFQSGWFVEGLLSQTLVHMLRTRKIPFIQSRAAAGAADHRLRNDCRHSAAVLAARRDGRPVPLPWSYFPAAGHAARLLPVAQGMKTLHQALWPVVLSAGGAMKQRNWIKRCATC